MGLEWWTSVCLICWSYCDPQVSDELPTYHYLFRLVLSMYKVRENTWTMRYTQA